nr:hypothetical protein [Bacteroidota bacterium]
MRKILILLFCMLQFGVWSQDTITVMHYNILNFGNYTSYCTVANNDHADKVGWLKVVIDHYLPDIFTVNEISDDTYYHQLILNSVLNASGRNYYQKANATNFANSDIINMLYFNSEKFGLAGQDVILHWLRDMNVYKLYYRDANLVVTNDTTFIYCIVSHLKAGSYSDDKAIRADMTADITEYIETRQITDPVFILGDLNLQNSSEQAWINLAENPDEQYRFSDPAQAVGSWHNNAAFSQVHTQSTHTVSNGCASSGGMDDRFDFVLCNPALFLPDGDVSYLEESFHIPGQDGQRLNGSLIDPPNYSAPEPVIEALYEMSDHCPVLAKFKIKVSSNTNLPATWDFIETTVSHIIFVPLEVNPMINKVIMEPGDYIGAFFMDGDQEKCAGHVGWAGSENIALIAFGDDIMTQDKDGFQVNENMILKAFSSAGYQSYYAYAKYDTLFQQHSGKFYPFGLSSLVVLAAADLQQQQITFEPGWSGVSAFIQPKWNSLENVLSGFVDQVEFFGNNSGFYLPGIGNQSLTDWESAEGYFCKSQAVFELIIEGVPVVPDQVDLYPGWNL